MTAAAADPADRQLGIADPHPLIASLWDAVQNSCEATFYSETDWQRLRLELWFADRSMAGGQPSATAWDAIQHGLSELLISPAVKRRAAIELKPAIDQDENAAVSMMSTYKSKLKPM